MLPKIFWSLHLKRLDGLAAGFILLASYAPSANAQQGGVTHVDTVVAASLKGNLLGDSYRRAVTVYLPPSYGISRQKRYPVVYLLHGFSADHRVFIKGPYQNINIRLSMDSLIRAGAVKEMIVVTPNAKNAYDGSFYANSPVTGSWEDFMVDDLLAYIDRRYRTIRSRSGRGITGHSMGGFGAFRIAMRHPEKFSAVYMMSAYGLVIGDSLRSMPATKAWKAALSVAKREDVLKAGFNADLDIALAAVYSPDRSSQPLYVDFPYRLEGDSLLLVDSVAAKWRNTPMAMVSPHASALRRLAIAFDAGTSDGFADIPASVTELDSLLTALRIAHTAEVYEGTHVGGIRARLETKVFPFFSKNLY